MPPLGLNDAERLKQLVVDPVVAALRSEMRETIRPLVDEISHLSRQENRQDERLDSIEQRLGSIERFKMKIAAVCSAVAVVAGVFWRMLLDWIRGHLPSKGH